MEGFTILWDALPRLLERELSRTDVRVSLDVCRTEEVRTPQWQPLLLSGKKVGESADLVEMLNVVATTIVAHTRAPVPILMDVNLVYRYLRLVYGCRYHRWNVLNHLRFCPPVFGVWHMYKYICFVVYRRFHSMCVFALHGTASDGQEFPTQPRLRSVEFLFAALLTLPDALRRDIRSMVAVLADRLRAVSLTCG